MPDIDTMIKALKLSWIKRLLQTNSNYNAVARTVANIDDFEFFFSHNNDSKFLKVKPTAFYEQIIEYWHELKGNKRTPNQVLNEKVKYNKDITIDGKPIQHLALGDKIQYIKDVLNKDYGFKSLSIMRSEGAALSQLEYNSLTSAIPREWIQILKTFKGQFQPIEDGTISINNKQKHIRQIRCNEFYKTLVTRKLTRPTALNKWEENYFYVNFDWPDLFNIPYVSSKETSLQSLQFQIVHRYFPCKYNLNTWYKTGDMNCDLCEQDIDSLEHYFFFCKSVKRLWQDFMFWFKEKMQMSLELGCLDILFGMLNPNNDPILLVINLCILYGKDFIRKQKMKGNAISLNLFLKNVTKRLEILQSVYLINGEDHKFNPYANFYEHCVMQIVGS
jgi:hypothetical protein